MERFAGAFILACWVGAFGFIYLRAALGTKRTVERVSWWWRIPVLVLAVVAIRFLPGLGGPQSGAVYWKRSPPRQKKSLPMPSLSSGL